MNNTAGAIARHLRSHVHGADPDVLAMEILAIVRGHGWRPTNVVPLPPQWQSPPGPPLPEDRVHAIAAWARQAITKEDPHG